MMSSARPDECSEPLSPERRPPYDVMFGNRLQIARCTRMTSCVTPDSTDEPDLQAACETLPPAGLSTGLVADRYCAFTQRDLPLLTISAQAPSILPVIETFEPRFRTSSRTPVSGTVHTFRSVVVNFEPTIFGGSAAAARVLVELGFGIGACFLRCLGAGAAEGFGVFRFSEGRSASRLVATSRASCRDELASGMSTLTSC